MKKGKSFTSEFTKLTQKLWNIPDVLGIANVLQFIHL